MNCKLLLIAVLALTPAFAQRPNRNRGAGESDFPAAVSTNRIDVIETMFNLTKDQKKAVKLTLDNAQKEAAPVREQLIKGHLAIGAAIQAGKSEQEIDQLIRARAELKSRMAEIEFKAFANIFHALDDAQRPNSPSLFPMMKGIFLEKNWNTIQ